MTAYILNLLDLLFTLHILNDGGMELNPAVGFLLELHPLAFPFCKIVVVGVLLHWLKRKARTYGRAKIGLAVITILYAAIVLWHIYNIYFTFGGAI